MKKSSVTTKILMLLILVLAISNLYFGFWTFYLNIQIADMISKVNIFDQMEFQATESKDAEESVDCLRYVWFYYPSGSGYQPIDSNGDYLVETLRKRTVIRITNILQKKYPEGNIGNNPIDWIRRYGQQPDQIEAEKNTKWFKKWYGEFSPCPTGDRRVEDEERDAETGGEMNEESDEP